jgi:hypothetical protein
VRARKEPLPPDKLSVRDQAIGRVVDVIARARGIPRHEAGKQIGSLYRSNSEAHKRGAFDVRIRSSKDPAKEAAQIRDSLGKGFVVIHEQLSADGKMQTNTYYRDNGTSYSETKPHGSKGYHADGPHIHVQPKEEIFKTHKE